MQAADTLGEQSLTDLGHNVQTLRPEAGRVVRKRFQPVTEPGRCRNAGQLLRLGQRSPGRQRHDAGQERDVASPGHESVSQPQEVVGVETDLRDREVSTRADLGDQVISVGPQVGRSRG